MKLVHKQILVILAVLCFLPCIGQETLVLKDGSIIYGHKTSENYSKGTLSYRVDSASLILPEKAVFIEDPELVRIDKMSSSWQRWFKSSRERIVNKGGDEYGWLTRIRTEYDGFPGESKLLTGNVVLQEKNDSTIRVVTVNPGNIDLSKKDFVDRIMYSHRDSRALAGVVDEVEMNSGEKLQGQIVEERRKDMVLLRNDNVRVVIPYSKIRAKRVLPLNSTMPINEQIEYKVRLSKDRNSAVEGFITEVVYETSKGNHGHYKVVNYEGRDAKDYDFDDVTKIDYFPNEQFVKDMDVAINNDEVFVAGKVVKPLKYRSYNGKYEVETNDSIVAIKLSDLNKGMLTLYYKNNDRSSDFIFEEAKEVNKIENVSADNKKSEFEHKNIYSVSFEDIMFTNFPSPKNPIISPLGNVIIKYGPVIEGKVYWFMPKSKTNKNAYLIRIEK